MTRNFFKAIFSANLVLSAFSSTLAAEVPDKIVVQGRAAIPSATLTGTATVLPAGLSRPFTINTDAYGIFQFDLTNLVPEAFENPNSSLRLEIGTTTINIPFKSVPFAFRAAKADALSVEAPAQFVTINVTTITATTINVTTITVNNIVAASATIQGSMDVGNVLTIGPHTVVIDGPNNLIKFTDGAGVIRTTDTASGQLTLETSGDNAINLNPGGTGVVSIGGTGEITATRYKISGDTVIKKLPGTGGLGVGVNAGSTNNTGGANTFIGSNAGQNNTTGANNSFLGYAAGSSNYNGWYNTFVGMSAGSANISGAGNSFLGAMAGSSNISGNSNTFVGGGSGVSNNTGEKNTFIGSASGRDTTTGSQNTMVGAWTGLSNMTGSNNIFIGFETGKYIQTGSANTFVGVQAGGNMPNQSFSSATLIGYHAGRSLINGGDNNIFIGFQAGDNLQIGAGNIVIGYDQDVLGGNETNNSLNIGGVLYGDLSIKTLGISKTIPAAALDIVSTGTAADQMAQIWRNSLEIVVASMSATGVMKALKFLGDGSGLTGVAGDNLGNHTATSDLNMAANSIKAVNAVTATGIITASAYQIGGNTVLGILTGGGESLGVGFYAGKNSTGYKNLFIGYAAGSGYNNTGWSNTFIGAEAGVSNTTGQQNVFIGAPTGYKNTTGWENTFIGAGAGYENTTAKQNSFVGSSAGFNNTTGGDNSFFGTDAGLNNNTGASNSVIGSEAGYYTQTGSANVIFGARAGYGATGNSFSSATLMGYQAGYNLTAGNDNIFVGWQAGYNATSGTGNIIIGYGKDTSAPTASNELNIGGAIYGDLSTGKIGIGTMNPSTMLNVYNRNIDIVNDNNIKTGTVVSARFTSPDPGTVSVGQGSIVSITGVNNRGPVSLGAVYSNQNKDHTDFVIYTGQYAGIGGNGHLERLRITDTGNVGIGTTGPIRKLHISDTNVVESVIEATDGLADFRKWNLAVNGLAGTAKNFYIRQLNDAGTGGNTRFFIQGSSGNVGIGTASPAQKLSVAGTIESITGGFKFPDGTTQATAAGGATQWTTSGSNIYYNTGNVGISSAAPVAQLGVEGSAVIAGTLTVQAIMPANFVGAVMFFAGADCPAGWLLANGENLPTTGVYAALFNYLQYAYGQVGGNFVLPNMVDGSFIRSTGGNAGVLGIKQSDEFRSHVHGIQRSYSNHVDSGGHAGFRAGNATTNATGGTETRPLNYAMTPCIKY